MVLLVDLDRVVHGELTLWGSVGAHHDDVLALAHEVLDAGLFDTFDPVAVQVVEADFPGLLELTALDHGIHVDVVDAGLVIAGSDVLAGQVIQPINLGAHEPIGEDLVALLLADLEELDRTLVEWLGVSAGELADHDVAGDVVLHGIPLGEVAALCELGAPSQVVDVELLDEDELGGLGVFLGRKFAGQTQSCHVGRVRVLAACAPHPELVRELLVLDHVQAFTLLQVQIELGQVRELTVYLSHATPRCVELDLFEITIPAATHLFAGLGDLYGLSLCFAGWIGEHGSPDQDHDGDHGRETETDQAQRERHTLGSEALSHRLDSLVHLFSPLQTQNESLAKRGMYGKLSFLSMHALETELAAGV